MNSGIASLGPSCAGCVRAPRGILLLTTIYVLILVAIGIAMMLIGSDSFFPICAAYVPATIYAIAACRYGRALFGDTEPAERNSSWSRLLRISASLYSLLYVVAVCSLITGSPGDLTRLLVCAITVGLLALWVYIGESAFLNSASPKRALGSTCLPAVGTAQLVGGVAILSSLALNVDYSSAGWRTLLWKGRWVTSEFAFYPLEHWINWTMFAGYASGLLLGLLAIIVGVMGLCGRMPPPGWLNKLLNFSVVTFWFTLTSYWGDCLYMSFVGIFILFWTDLEKAYSSIATALWVGTFLLGVLLWFRYGKQSNSRGRKVRTILLLWSIPIMALTLATFWYAAVWELYGLILFVAGVQIVTACCWKVSSDRPVDTHVAVGSV